MTVRPWSYVFHFQVAPVSSLDANEVTVTYDDVTDTFFGNLRPLRGPTLSCWVDRYEYLRLDIASREPVGTQVESFTRHAIAHKRRYLELAALSEELFKPTRPAKHLVSSTLKLNVVHHAVVLATRNYDRLHGVRGRDSRSLKSVEGMVSLSMNEIRSSAVPLADKTQPLPPHDWVVDEFKSFLDLIARTSDASHLRDFDRILRYWSSQPSGLLKQETGRLLLRFIQENGLDRFSSEWPMDALRRSIKAS